MQYGVESLSNSLLRKMAKAPRAIENLRCLKLTELAGMQPNSNLIKFFPREVPSEVVENLELILRFPEVLNGDVLSGPIEFRIRADAGIERHTMRRGYAIVDRAINHRLWPEDVDARIPDIEWIPELRSPDPVLHHRLWAEVADALEANRTRRLVTRYDDDGEVLHLTKYDHRVDGPVSYALRDGGRAIYLALEDVRTVGELAASFAVAPAVVDATLAWLEDALLVLRDGDRAIATIHRRSGRPLDPRPTADAEPVVAELVPG